MKGFGVSNREAKYGTRAIANALEEARSERVDVPAYAFDVHTPGGRKRGKTKADFFVEEFEALHPRVSGVFDGDLKRFRQGRTGGAR